MLPVAEYPEGVSLIICTYNGAGRIVKTLEHMLRQEVASHIRWEVIVVDNGSADQTAQMAADTWQSVIPLKIVPEMRRGITFAREGGIAHAAYEFISFIDDDNWIATNWVNEVYKSFTENHAAGMCGGANEAVFEVPPPLWFNSVQACYAVGKQGDKTMDVTHTRGFLWGAGMSFRKSYYLKIISAGFIHHTTGRVGSRLSAGDDAELSIAFIAAGYRLWYVDSMNLMHFMPATRLTWFHAKGIFTGLGESEYLLDLYRHAIRRTRFPFVMIYGSLIRYSMVYFGWRFVTLMKDQENNPRYLSYIARKAYIFKALRSMLFAGKLMEQIEDFCRRAVNLSKFA
jgi:glycosyltransferase involved in cell wall biosynthesis